MKKATWSIIFLLVALLLSALYHNGVAGEEACLAKGYTASECARLRD